MYMLEWPQYEAVNNPVTGACCSLSAWWCAATEPEWSTYPDEWEFHEVIPQFPYTDDFRLGTDAFVSACFEGRHMQYGRTVRLSNPWHIYCSKTGGAQI
jgi:hypothetical protein